MATFDLRILLETVEGIKTSYYSNPFIDTDDGLILSASEAYGKITGSFSCSYQNQIIFSGDDIVETKLFKSNLLLSASLTGSLDTGSIVLKATTSEYDRLYRYKFFGEKVCNTLGLPSAQWVYVDKFRLPSNDNEVNIFEGNVNAGNLFVGDTLTFANDSTINSDIPFLIDTGSDRHIKFIDERNSGTLGMIIGYDKSLDTYEISGSTENSFSIGGVNKLVFADGTEQVTAGGSDSSGDITGIDLTGGTNISIASEAGTTSGDYSATINLDASPSVTNLTASGNTIFGNAITDTHTFTGHITSSGNISASGNLFIKGDGEFGMGSSNPSVRVQNIDDSIGWNLATKATIHSYFNPQTPATTHFGIKTTAPTVALQVKGDISASGALYATNISASSTLKIDSDNDILVQAKSEIFFRSGSTNYARFDAPSGTLGIGTSTPGNNNALLTVAGNISASGNLFIQGSISASSINTTIVSSSVIFSSGSNIFGDASDDSHTFNGGIIAGNITASGNISSSGTILGAVINSMDEVQSQGHRIGEYDGVRIRLGDADKETLLFGSKIQTTQPLNVLNSITASGNISSSGTIESTGNISTLGDLTIGGAIAASGIISSSTQLPRGILSSSAQIVESLPFGTSGIISSSAQIVESLPFGASGIISSSAQLPSGILSSSTQIVESLPFGTSGIFSASAAGSSQGKFKLNGVDIDVNGLGTDGDVTFDTLILDAGGLKGVGAFSSSAQLPSGIFSGSAAGTSQGQFQLNEVDIDVNGLGTDGDVTFDTLILDAGGLKGVGAFSSSAQFASDNVLLGHITASNISASGNLFIKGDGEFGMGSSAPSVTIQNIDDSIGWNLATKATIHSYFNPQTPATTHFGIKTTTPSVALEVKGDISASGALWATNISASSTLKIDSDNDILVQAKSEIFFRSGSTNYARFDAPSGTLGIGTSTPGNNDALLTVAGNISSSGAIHTLSHITASGNISASGTIESTGNISTLGDLTIGGAIAASGIISSSAQVVESLPFGTSGIFSASAAGSSQGKFKLNGVDVDVNGLGTDGDVTFDTLILDAGGLKGVGAFSSSAQLPSGIFSGSAAGTSQGQFQLNGVDIDVNGLGTDGDVTFDTLILDAGGLKGVGAFSSSAQFASEDILLGNITASNISASGNLFIKGDGEFGMGSSNPSVRVQNIDDSIGWNLATKATIHSYFNPQTPATTHFGIKTTTPSVALEVKGDISASGALYATNISASSTLKIDSDNDILVQAKSEIFFRSGSTNYARFDAPSGTLGIGTSTPGNNNALLTVAGNISASGDILTLGDLTIGGAIAASGIISSSTQLPRGILSSSAQIVESLPFGTSGIISSSTQIVESLPFGASGIISSSAQIVESLPFGASGIVSSSAQTTANLPSGIFSASAAGSSQGKFKLNGVDVDVNGLGTDGDVTFDTLILDAGGLKGVGAFSSSAQLPSGIFSGSAAGTSQGQFQLNEVDIDVNGLGTDGDVTFDTLILDAGGLKGVGAFSSSAQFASEDILLGNITASNISASGNLFINGNGTFGMGSTAPSIRVQNIDDSIGWNLATKATIHSYFNPQTPATTHFGIKTTTPSVALEVKGDISASGALWATNISASSTLKIDSDNDILVQAKSEIFFRSGSTNYARFDAPSGALGIGTSTPGNNNALLTVAGNISASGDILTLGDLTIGGAIAASGIISSSTQLPRGILSSSAQIVESLPFGTSGIISSSTQIVESLPFGASGIISSSAQIVESLPFGASGIVSSSAQTTANLPSGIFSASAAGSSQGKFKLNGVDIDVNGLGTDGDVTFDTLVLDAGGLKGVGAFSSSAQLPSGIFSGSAAGTSQGQFQLNGVDIDVNGLGTDGDVTFDTLILDAGGLKGVGAFSSSAQFASEDILLGNITSSGNISASGNLFINGNGTFGMGSSNPSIRVQNIDDSIGWNLATKATIHSYFNPQTPATTHFGIKTTTPSVALEVKGDISASGALYATNISASSTLKIDSDNDILVQAKSEIFFRSGSTNYARFDAPSGTLGIGTSTPGNNDALLTVAGNVSSSGAINTLSHITASGNYSGSATSTFVIGGKLQAGSKSFLIPTPEGGKLEYGALEGPQNDVFFRGELKGDDVIYLPREWEWLVDENTITTQLTSIGKHQELYFKEIKENKIFIDINGILKTKENIHCYYIIHGTRKDIELIRNYQ